MQETNLSKDDARITRIEIVKEPYSNRFGFEPDTEERKAFFELCSTIYQCGQAARENQKMIHRSFKYDGSILTETDLAVSDAVLAQIRRLYPDCNIVTEEIDLHDFKEGARYTFVLDPIDGTDAYSQGLPTWCVSCGILDSHRKPCGAVVFAPRFGVGTQELFCCSMPGDARIFCNGMLHETPRHYDEPKQMVIGSTLNNFMDTSPFRGKIRAFGSSIIHMLAPVFFSNLDCTINPYCFAWDVAGANGILVKSGLDIVYCDGSEIEYDDDLLLRRNEVRTHILVGNKGCIKWMRENLDFGNRSTL